MDLCFKWVPERNSEKVISRWLRLLNLEASPVIKMRKRQTPLFLVALRSRISLEELNKNYALVDNTKIRWNGYEHTAWNPVPNLPTLLIALSAQGDTQQTLVTKQHLSEIQRRPAAVRQLKQPNPSTGTPNPWAKLQTT